VRRALLLVVAAALCAPATALADETIALVPGGQGFRPNSVTVRAGEQVVWRNDDRVPRRVAADRDAFSVPVLRPGQSAVVRFREIGTFGFHDAKRPELRGAVVVDVPLHSVTIVPSPASPVYGRTVTLAGRVSSGRPGEEVTVLRQSLGEPQPNVSDVVQTTAGGRWSVVVSPGSRTVYQARWADAQSRRLVVPVRVAVVLVRAGGGLEARAGGGSVAGRRVELQGRSARGPWRTLATATLGPDGRARFPLAAGVGMTTVRAVVRRPPPGFAPGASPPLRL
jgi:plastocyanin